MAKVVSVEAVVFCMEVISSNVIRNFTVSKFILDYHLQEEVVDMGWRKTK